MSTDTLMPQARRYAATVGRVPTRNQLMSELAIAGHRASALRDELIREEARADLLAARTSPTTAVTAPRRPRWRAARAHLDAATHRLRKVGTGSSVTVAPAELAEVAPAQVAAPEASPALGSVAVDDGGHHLAPKPVRAWPILILGLPAFVAIWSGWVELGEMAGFGIVHPLPGIWDSLAINSAITLPIGMETYAAYAVRVWLSPSVPRAARRFAAGSAIGSLVLGAAGQVAYHQMAAAGWTSAPWQITTVVSCLPVLVFGLAAGLYHLVHRGDR